MAGNAAGEQVETVDDEVAALPVLEDLAVALHRAQATPESDVVIDGDAEDLGQAGQCDRSVLTVEVVDDGLTAWGFAVTATQWVISI